MKTVSKTIFFSEQITLPCVPSHDLDWSDELARAERLPSVIWKFDLGLELPLFSLDDELSFQALARALRYFSEQVWPQFNERTSALVLYQGSGAFERSLLWSARQKERYERWLEEEERRDSVLSRRLMAADALAIYFQMLAHRLPDDAPIFLLFDLSPFVSITEALTVVSKDRFEHFSVALRHFSALRDGWVWAESGLEERKVEAAQGLVFPENCDPCFDALVREYPKAKIVFESFLTEEWEGLDQLIALKGSISAVGERKLAGFAATGGDILNF